MQQPTNLASLWQQILQLTLPDSDHSQMLMAIAACVGEAFQVDTCTIVFPDVAQSVTHVACWSANAPPLPDHLLTTTSDFFERLLTHLDLAKQNKSESQQVTVTPANMPEFVESWQSVEPLRASLKQVKAVLNATTHVPGYINGVISLMRSRAHAWTESEIAGLQAVSYQVASLIDQRQLQQRLGKQRQYQQVVNQLTMAIHNAADLTEVVKLATDGTAKALQVKRGMLLRLKYWDTLFRPRPEAQIPKIRVNVICEWLDIAARVEPSSQAVAPESPSSSAEASQSFWIAECTLCQEAFLHPDRPVTIPGAHQLPPFDASGVAAAFHLDTLPTALLAPLESQGTVLGFLVFQHERSHVWQAEELELVQLVSAQVSTAIIQTETLRQVQGLVEKRTAELRESLSVQAKLYDRTRHQLDQLRCLNQIKDEFLSTVSHELRTPLTSMKMAICMLRQTDLPVDRSSRYLDILEQQCAQETNLINDLLALQEAESNQITLHWQEIDLKVLIRELAKLFRQKWEAKGLTLDLKLPRRPLKLMSDHASLHRILLELLTNAGKYADPNTCVQLHVTQTTEQPINQIIVTLCNVGPGIAPDELPLIFDKFKRCQRATQDAIQGTGLGLSLVKSLIQHLNGTIAASSCTTEDSYSCDTRFTLTLPQMPETSKLH